MSLRDSLRTKWWIGYKCKTKHHTKKDWDDVRRKYMKRGRQKLDDDQKIEVPLPALRNDPCVTDEVWNAVQTILDRHVKEYSTQKSRLDQFLGSGLAHCTCGRRLYHTIRNKTLKYYFCGYVKLKTGTPCKAPMIRAERLDNEIMLQIEMYFGDKSDGSFLRARVKESLSQEKTAEKRLAVARLDKDIERLNRELGRVAETSRRVPNIEALAVQLEKVNEEIAEAEEKRRRANAELALVLSDNDVDKITLAVQREFAGFSQKNMTEKKELLARFIERINVRQDEFAGIVCSFDVKIGVAEMLYQRDRYPEPPPSKGRKPSKPSNEPLRIKKPDGSWSKLDGTSPSSWWTATAKWWTVSPRRPNRAN